jgi:hypothetical protein
MVVSNSKGSLGRCGVLTTVFDKVITDLIRYSNIRFLLVETSNYL